MAYGKYSMKGNSPMKRKDKKPMMSQDYLDLAPPKSKGKRGPKVPALSKEKQLEAHAEHHTKKHMALMRKLMKEGKTFDEAHKAAQKKVGK